MASLYDRPRSPFIWIRFKDEAGEWRGKATGYRRDNLGDRRQAKLLARKVSQEERERRPQGHGAAFDEWVERWLSERYGGREGSTLTVYRRHWRHLSEWFKEQAIHSPGQLRYTHLVAYRSHRLAQGACGNTVIHEVNLCGRVMQEAIRREFATSNPCLRLGWQRDKAKEKAPWSDAEFQQVRKALEKSGPQWMLVTLLLGFYQAARLRQCAVPLADIDLQAGSITYRRTKGDKPFSQPLDPRLVPTLRRIVDARRKAGKKTLCDIPILPSVEWRRFLNSLGLFHLVHHGLRVSWITRAASSGKVSEPLARRFVNHGSQSIHMAYQKLSVSDVAHVPALLDLPE